jgi:hypothetical protein
VPRDGVTRHLGQVGQVLDEPTEGHVLAEGHAVDLVVAGDDAPLGAEHDRGVAEPQRPRDVLDHPDDERRLELAGEGRELRLLG